MLSGIVTMIGLPLLLLAVLFVGAFIGMAIEQAAVRQRRAAWKRRNVARTDRSDWRAGPKAPKSAPIPDAADQLRIVINAQFKARPLLNKSESRLFAALNRIVAEIAPDWRVMAQVNLGEILASQDDAAYRCVNSKRVDLLLIDADWCPLHAIEYQGSGHHQATAAARDATKKEALRRAGIGYHEVIQGDTPAELRRLIEKLAKPGGAPAPRGFDRKGPITRSPFRSGPPSPA